MLLSQQYDFDFDHPVETLWAIVSDTPRWGEASGLPRYQVREDLQEDGNVKVFGSLDLAGFQLQWEEPPANWIAPLWFEQQRLFSRGPISRMSSRATLTASGERSKLHIELSFETKNPIGMMLARRMLSVYRGKASALLADADRLIRAEQPELFLSHYKPDASAHRRARQISTEIVATPFHHGLCERLVDYINSSQEVDLWTMRPLALARRWQVSARKVIELFLQSVRSGLLESRWDILCPRCRVSRSQIANMSDLPDGVHCDACNIDFEADFAANVELSFSPSPSIRSVGYGYYCRSGPGMTPHIKSQCSLPAASGHSLPLALSAGNYRIRTLEAGAELDLNWEQGPFPAICIADDSIDIVGASPTAEISIQNKSARARTLVIENQNWRRDILTAAEVTTLQAFRDLFSDQLLRPGDDVSIRNISFLFTDLIASTRLFQRLGDAAAYHLVREHFAVLGGIVRRHQGSIVKTVGDGVHAAFMRPEDALYAAVEMQQSMAAFNDLHAAEDVSIRIGLHSGSCIAVTLNQQLDYYGEAVNMASRMEGQGDAGDITMSASFVEDSAIGAILQEKPQKRRQVTLKGLSNPVTIVQINSRTSDDKSN